MTSRRQGLLLALAAFFLMAFAQYNNAGLRACSTPPEEGLPPCPEHILLHMASFAGGIVVASAAGKRANPSTAFAGIAGGFAAGSLLAVARGHGGTVVAWLGVAAATAAAYSLSKGVLGLRRARAGDELMAGAGLLADGTVLAVTPTGTVVNGDRVMRVRMRIEPFGMMPPYEAEQSLPLAGPLEVGDRCAVWVRPGDPEQWVFRTADAVSGPPAGPASADVVVDLAALNFARRAGRIDAAEFARLARIALGTP